jgi:pimeloyl-ACP methyl ester carboxylesterase
MELKDPDRHSAELAFMVEESMKADPDGALASLMDAFGCDFRAALPEISLPTLLLYGSFSQMTTPANCEYMERVIPDSRLEMFHESAHTLMLEEPEKFNRVVDVFAKATS